MTLLLSIDSLVLALCLSVVVRTPSVAFLAALVIGAADGVGSLLHPWLRVVFWVVPAMLLLAGLRPWDRAPVRWALCTLASLFASDNLLWGTPGGAAQDALASTLMACLGFALGGALRTLWRRWTPPLRPARSV